MKATSSQFRTACRQLWGEADRQRTLAPGVVAFSTPGHGGIIVDPSVFKLDPRLVGGLFDKPVQWTFTSTGEVAVSLVPFEEDCDWAALLYCHPDLIEPAVKKGWLAEGVDGPYIRRRIHSDDYYQSLWYEA